MYKNELNLKEKELGSLKLCDLVKKQNYFSIFYTKGII
jgi:hypothetical protein